MGPITAPSRNAPACGLNIVMIVSTNANRQLQKTSCLLWQCPRELRKRALEALPRPFAASEGAGTRTQNLRLKRALLCQLSYSPDSPGASSILADRFSAGQQVAAPPWRHFAEWPPAYCQAGPGLGSGAVPRRRATHGRLAHLTFRGSRFPWSWLREAR